MKREYYEALARYHQLIAGLVCHLASGGDPGSSQPPLGKDADHISGSDACMVCGKDTKPYEDLCQRCARIYCRRCLERLINGRCPLCEKSRGGCEIEE